MCESENQVARLVCDAARWRRGVHWLGQHLRGVGTGTLCPRRQGWHRDPIDLDGALAAWGTRLSAPDAVSGAVS
ncbi:hypothetical protein Sjap_010646 [Stephania japonica]|uniref:Uncharacterized protein n=1 Tax=Stephania japonica TaxID=461633 RepID=A0AAP0J9Z2_9MAGN